MNQVPEISESHLHALKSHLSRLRDSVHYAQQHALNIRDSKSVSAESLDSIKREMMAASKELNMAMDFINSMISKVEVSV